MFKTAAIVVGLLLAGAFLNSRHSPTNRVCDRIVDRTVEFVQQTQHTASGLASDVQTEVVKKN
jgi:hypothetical protein